MTKIKICGLFREEDIHAVNDLLPDYIGFIINYPKSHRSISFEKVKELKSMLKPEIKAVGVFVNQNQEDIVSISDCIDIIQLHGGEDNNYISELKSKTDKSIIKAFIIKSKEDIDKANMSLADYILLDGGMGEGKAFCYEFLNEIKRRFFIAGGLTPENVHDVAIKTKAYAVDISSGVETDKMKDYNKISKAINAIRRKEG